MVRIKEVAIRNFSWLHLKCDQLGFKINLIQGQSFFVFAKTSRITLTFYLEIREGHNNVVMPSQLLNIISSGDLYG